jgi:hypothetical protein
LATKKRKRRKNSDPFAHFVPFAAMIIFELLQQPVDEPAR